MANLFGRDDVGIGIALPFGPGVSNFKINYTTLDQAKTNIINLLLTHKGERFMQPEFGTNLRRFLFRQNTQNLADNSLVKQYLNLMKDNNKLIGAICAAPYVLHKANILDCNYTCYPSFEEKIGVKNYLEKNKIVIDKNIITSKGPATAMQFSLEIIKLLENENLYNQVKNGLLYDK